MAKNQSKPLKAGAGTRIVRCPRCNKSCRYDAANAWRPFCSAACKNEDIVSWATESYRIPGPPLQNDEEKARGQVDGHGEDEGG